MSTFQNFVRFGAKCPGAKCPWGILSWGILSFGAKCLGAKCLLATEKRSILRFAEKLKWAKIPFFSPTKILIFIWEKGTFFFAQLEHGFDLEESYI